MSLESRSITADRRRHEGARSVLLMTSRSDRVIPGPAFARNFVSARHVDDVDRCIDKLRTETRGEVVAAAFQKHDVEIRKPLLHFGDGVEVDGSIFANCSVRDIRRSQRR